MRIFDKSGQHYIELDDKYRVRSRGFVGRYKTNGFNPVQLQQATESPLIHDGSQCVLSTTQDARQSTITGTTLNGPAGSGQYLCVVLSAARTVSIASSANGAAFGTAGNEFYGILQNRPAGGQAADVGIFGISKVVAASTSIVAGGFLQMSSAASSLVGQGTVSPWIANSGQKIGMALEAPTSTGQIITAAIFGFGGGPGST